ncbi:hypothetical protein KA082_01470 [Candidatus Woesebacteria bacterium]|nr:hypothetical protein [Candidatus Woesebacteria bacterium]
MIFRGKSLSGRQILYRFYFLVVFLCFIFICGLINPRTVSAATLTWDGGGNDATCGGAAGDGNKWSCAANWSTDTLPQAADTAVFNGTATKNATINSSINITAITIDTGYTGTITQAAGATITLSSTSPTAALSQAAGTFIGSASDITLSTGGFSLTAGSFTAPSGTFSIGRNFTITGGSFIHNSGIVSFIYGTQNSVLACNGAVLNAVSFAKSAATEVAVGADCTIPLLGTNPSSSADVTNNGTIAVTGDWTISGDYTSNSGAVLTATGSTLTVGESMLLTGGTFPANINTVLVGRNFSNSGNILHDTIALTLNGTINSTLGCGTATFASVTINKTTGSTITPTSSCTTGDFSLLAGTLTNPASSYTYSIAGNLTLNVTTRAQTFGGANIPVVLNGSSDQNIIQNHGAFLSPLTITKATGAAILLTDFFATNNQLCTLSQGTFNLNGYDFYCSSTFSLNTATVLQLGGYEFFTTPVIAPTATITFKGRSNSAVDSFAFPSLSYQNLTINTTEASDIFDSRDILANNLVGHWKMEAGSGAVDDSSVNNNTASLNGSAAYSATVPTLVGETNNYSMSFDGSGDYLNPGGSTSVVQNVPAVTMSAWIRKNSNTSIDQIIGYSTNGSTSTSRVFFQTNASTLECGGRSTDAETTQSVATNSILSTGIWYHVSCIIDFQHDKIGIYLNGSLQITDGVVDFSQSVTDNTTSQNSSIGIDEDKIGNDYDGLIDEIRLYTRALSATEVAALGAGKNTSAVTSPITVAQDFTITSGVLYAPSELRVAGNWSNNGTFNHNSGQVVLSGTNQTISGESTFNTLTKQVTSAATLTFQATKTQTIVGTLQLEGIADNLLSLRSSSTGTQWRIDPQTTRTIGYLDVADSNNINSTPIAVNGLSITDSGNNTNWSFSSGIPAITLTPLSPDPSGDTTPTITGTATDDSGTVAAIEYQIDGTGGTWIACTADDGTFDEQSENFSCTVGTALTNGSHTLYVRATDNDAQVTANADAATDSFTIDSAAPALTITQYTPDPTGDTTPTLVGNATDVTSNVTLVEFQVDGTGGSWAACTPSDGSFSGSSENFSCTVVTPLSDGAHSIYFRATDSLGNVTSALAASSDSFIVDSTPPTLPGTPIAITIATDSTPTWQWAQSTDIAAGLSATTAYTLQWSKSSSFSSGVLTAQVGTNNCSGGFCVYTHSTSLADGTWYFRVKTTDAVGNESAYSSNGSHFIDATNPTLSLIPISPDPGINNTPTLTGTASDSSSVINSVQYQVDSTAGQWTACTADDGAFDEQSEAFSCTIGTELTGGTHTIYTRATDAVGNVSSNLTGHRDVYSLDLSSPSISLTALSPDPTSDTTPSITGTTTEDVGTVSAVSYQIDGTNSTWRSCTADDGAFDEQSEAFTCTTTVLTPGPHTIYVRASDSTGNTTIAASAATDSFTVDTAAPTITLTPLAPDPTSDSTPAIGGSVSDLYSTIYGVEFQLNGTSGAWTACSAVDGAFDEQSENFSCQIATPQSDGTYTIYVRSTDALMHTTAVDSYSSDTFVINTTTAIITLTPLSPDPTSDTTPTLSGSVTDTAATISTVEFQVDSTGGSWSSCIASDGTFDELTESFTCTAPTVTDGTHTVYVRSSNSLSVTTASGAAPSDTFVVDTTAPAVSLTALSPDPTSDATPTFTGSTTDAASLVTSTQYSVDNTTSWNACTASDGSFNEISEAFSCTVATTLSDGPHTIYIKTIDFLGNATNSGYASDSFTISTTAPTITITPLSPDPTADSTPSISANVVSTHALVSAVEYSVDTTSGTWNSCTADDGTFDEASEIVTCTAATLTQGSHVLYMRAHDSASVTTPNDSLVGDVFTVDTSGPLLTLTALIPDPNSDTTPTFSGTASDLYSTVAGVSYQVDGTSGGWSNCTPNDSSFGSSVEQYNCTTSPLSYGTHTIYVRGVDNLGNVTSIGSYRQDTFTLSATAPTIATAPTGSIAITTATENNPSYTQTRAVTLQLTATDTESVSSLLSMRISENNAFSDTTWESFNSSKNATLSPTDGLKYIYLQLKDPDELTSQTYFDTIFLDTTAPTTPELNEPAESSYTASTTPVFKFKISTDSGAGLQKYQLFIDGNLVFDAIPPITPDSTNQRTETDRIITYNGSSIQIQGIGAHATLTTGSHTWSVTAIDAVGNTSSSDTKKFTIDTTAPSLQLEAIGSDTQLITTNTVAGKVFAVAQNMPQFRGTGEENSTITISSEGSVLCQTKAQSSGAWSCTPNDPLKLRRYSITITSSDAAGNSLSLPLIYLFIGNTTLNLSTALTTYPTPSSVPTTATTTSSDANTTESEQGNELSGQLAEGSYDVRIVVTDEQKRPIKGAKVTLFSTPREGITDENGVVIFKTVEGGDHTIVISHNNAIGKRALTVAGEVKTIEVAVVVTQQNPFSIPFLLILLIGIAIGIILFSLFLYIRKRPQS